MAKKVTPQSIIGQMGANLIERVVLQMRYVWRPLLIFDVGIDGEIEICDPATGEATNTIIKVQAKATTRPFQAETPDSFEYLCEKRDLDYWLRGNAPVILVVCRPDTEEAYWVSIKDYFRDSSVQKARKVHFDKHRDRFDASCAPALKQLALPRDSGIYFTPLQKTESLFTNLLEVASFAPKIYIAHTDCRKLGEAWAKLKSAVGGRVGAEWVLAHKQIISFHNLEEFPFNTICDLGTCETFDTSEWSDTEDEDRKREFVRLLNLCLRERTRLLGLYFDKKRQHYFFPATKGLKTRRVKYQSIQRRVSREVFKQHKKKRDPTQSAYCRHSAFEGYFLRLGDDWYLEITPTYHFTFNGYREDMFRAERLKGIKRLERNPAVVGQLLMWADYLKRSTRNLFSPEYPFLSFGELATVDIGTGLPDDIWYYAEESGEARRMQATANQLRLLGL